MPIGIQRLNAKKSQPNTNIIFIKPLPGKDEAVSQDFLERISAQCLPIMREHHLSVMTLEEFPPNREFVGRNFNAGEVIQLVLRSRSSGAWLPFPYVQMVMMHELAHCKQMNHSRAFWAVRNQYAEQMRGLWGRGYTGEGLWGRGASLLTGGFETRVADLAGDNLPEHLCGGTYRSRRRKRKGSKPQLSYREQKERRILKKFGKGGVAVGDDEVQKMRLEGKFVGTKPRVARSKRGRELRAAAALARYGESKKEAQEENKRREEEEDGIVDDGVETESGSDYEDADAGVEDAVDITGDKLLDGKGHHMIKICEDEDLDDQDARRELLELQTSMGSAAQAPIAVAQESAATRKRDLASAAAATSDTKLISESEDTPRMTQRESESITAVRSSGPKESRTTTTKDAQDSPRSCPVCSFSNEALQTACGMCAHVLDPESAPDSWKCKSEGCKDSLYVNSGDCGVCGVCGQRRT